jgi:Domain of unknown function (DUF1905)
MQGRYRFEAEVWEHEGPAAWYFVSLPDGIADEIAERHGARAAGFGSLRVEATVGGTTWQTSIFPDRKRQTYLLPVKAAVRRAEGLHDGSRTTLLLRVLAG